MNRFNFQMKSKFLPKQDQIDLVKLCYSSYLIENEFNFKCFVNLFNHLFTDLKHDDNKYIQIFFDKYDLDKDKKLNEEEFRNLWFCLISKIIFPKCALLIVDMQNDFINGSLALKNFPAKENPEEIIPLINKLIEQLNFDLIFYTLDWHPENHISFYDNFDKRKILSVNSNQIKSKEELNVKLFDLVKFETKNRIVEQKLWPKHCVQNTKGADFHEKLIIKKNGIKIFKGTNPEVDSYSGFSDNLKINKTDLDKFLKKNQITHIFVCGVATDFCVGETLKEAIDLGYITILIEDACCGVDSKSISEMKSYLSKQNCLIEKSTKIQNILNLKQRPFCFALNSISNQI